MNKIIEQIEKIKQINSNENLVIFVGAGVSKNSGVCSWWELVKEIADKIGGIQAADAHSTAGIQQGPAGGDDLQRQRCDKRPQQLFPLFMAPSNALFALPEEQRNGHQHKQQRPPAL